MAKIYKIRGMRTIVIFLPCFLWAIQVLEQPFYTTTDIKTRMTIIKLGEGSVLAYSPIAATGECLALAQSLVGKLPTDVIMQNNAIDHTIFLDSWRQGAPHSQIWSVDSKRDSGNVLMLYAMRFLCGLCGTYDVGV